MNNSDYLAEKAYKEIQSRAESNMLIQGLSGILGTFVTAAVDVAVIGTHYAPMFDKIRYIYNRGSVEGNIVSDIVSNILEECLFDLVFDKVLGYIPIIGIATNVMCAKAMTWRLGILFSMLASRGDEINSSIVKDCMFVIRNIFPQNNSFTLAQPDFKAFSQMLVSVHNNSQYEFADKINKAKDALR